jgi:tetratricopeptide (TPR) repeat protein
MLFDLRGKGRRRTIKVIYVGLAFLMGGGLVLLGIGGDVNGGLLNAITGTPSSDTGEGRYKKQAAAAAAATKRNPQDPKAWRDLTRARIQVASSGNRLNTQTGQYTEEGKERLKLAVSSWEKYLELDDPDIEEKTSLASRMVQTFVALGDFTQAARAQEIIAEDRKSVGAYSQLAVLSYQAGQTRKGDLAADKAIELAPKDERESLKGQLESAKSQGLVNQVAPQPEE